MASSWINVFFESAEKVAALKSSVRVHCQSWLMAKIFLNIFILLRIHNYSASRVALVIHQLKPIDFPQRYCPFGQYSMLNLLSASSTAKIQCLQYILINWFYIMLFICFFIWFICFLGVFENIFKKMFVLCCTKLKLCFWNNCQLIPVKIQVLDIYFIEFISLNRSINNIFYRKEGFCVNIEIT